MLQWDVCLCYMPYNGVVSASQRGWKMGANVCESVMELVWIGN